MSDLQGTLLKVDLKESIISVSNPLLKSISMDQLAVTVATYAVEKSLR